MDVKTAGRTVEIFETFAQTQQPLSLSEISRALGAPLSSCLYLVRALESRGYIYSIGSRKQVYPTRKLLDLAEAIAEGDSWLSRVQPILAELRNATGETVILGKRQGNRVLYLAVIEGTQTIRYTSRAGELKPLYSSAIGKAVLSTMSEAEQTKTLRKIDLDPITDATIIDRDALLDDLHKSREQGIFITRGENVPDVMAVARPINIGGDLYALAIAGPLPRMERDVDDHVKSLIHYCAQISQLR